MLLALVVGATACRSGRRPARFELVNRPGAGRVATCPDGATDVFGDGTPSPMDARCSYDDALGEGLTQVRGKVLAESDTGPLPTAVEGAVVTVHPFADEAGGSGRLQPAVARAITDAQGSFSLSAMLRAGTYVFAVDGSAQRTIELSDDRDVRAQGSATHGSGARSLDDVRIVLPADPRLSPTPAAN
jgi:hypothetical protein